ncbi:MULTISPECIES: hypothetical protein [unclassified Sphingomonas]|uniref:hypothetical protein n=1 Tax=unclassified Sphingomonas TaxID=196159 RepID=UPI00226A7EB9|nr:MULTISPECIES: hypothetical protein [unclassified Sphingomonas]
MRWPLPAHWHAALCRRRLATDIEVSLAARARARRPRPPETKRFQHARPKVVQLLREIATTPVEF